MQRFAKQAARERERQQLASQRAYAQALRGAEAARKREAQAFVRARKASAAEQKQWEKEAKQSHEAAMVAEVECKNLRLAGIEDDLQGILAATLGVDDFVDLNTLRVQVQHPPFGREDLRKASRPALPVIDAPAPGLVEPPAPRGLLSVLRKGAYEKAKMAAAKKHRQDMEHWQASLSKNAALRNAEAAAFEERERIRLAALAVEEARYVAECERREAEAAERNRAVDELITSLGYGTSEAIEEYIGIVLSNAIYPEHFPINFGFAFDPATAELRLTVAVIPPEQLSSVKCYKYVKASDEITAVPMSAKACKDRYASAIAQVALRVPHEIFEADRRALIGSISLSVGTHTNDPATGKAAFIALVAMGVARGMFMKLDLANVQPTATLEYLGASVSKNPFGLVPANTTGVRRS